MRKLISIVLTILILLTMPLNAFAAENTSTRIHDELIQLGCDVFPEYAAKILNYNYEGKSNSTFSSKNDLIIQETRNITDNATLTYSEFSNNLVVLTNVTYSKSVIGHSSEWISGTLYRFNCGVRVTCNYSSNVFVASNIIYEDSNETYATITSTGELSDSTADSSAFWTCEPNETAYSPAYTSYVATFLLNDGTRELVRIALYIQDHTRWAMVEVK